MDAKNAAYFCAGAALGVVGTIAFLWFYQEEPKTEPEQPEEKHISEPISRSEKSSIDGYEYPDELVNYDQITAEYITAGTIESKCLVEQYIHNEPVRVTEEQFESGNFESNYDAQGLTLYADDILANSVTDEVMSESDAFVALGPNFMPRKLRRIFDGEETESVFVRNDKLYTQYEITFDDRPYKEVTGWVMHGD